jgi:hypothetical protein
MATLKAFTVSLEPFFADPEPSFARITARYINIPHVVLEEPELTPFEGAETGQDSMPEQ